MIFELDGRKKYTLLAPDGSSDESSTPGELGGYRPKRIYGRLDCPSVLRAIAKGGYVEHRVFFANEQAAIAAGYRPCGKCMNEQYARWKKGGVPGSADYPWHRCPRQAQITVENESEESNSKSSLSPLMKPETTKHTRDLTNTQPLKEGGNQMSLYRLPSGRELQLSRFALASTYLGVMEGSPEIASKFILERVAERAARLLSPAHPLVVVPSSEIPLPRWMCVASLSSPRGVRQKDPDYQSCLFVCWFTDNTDRSIDTMIEEILPHLDWEKNAQDYDIMDF